jgi:hypothetical protein
LFSQNCCNGPRAESSHDTSRSADTTWGIQIEGVRDGTSYLPADFFGKTEGEAHASMLGDDGRLQLPIAGSQDVLPEQHGQTTAVPSDAATVLAMIRAASTLRVISSMIAKIRIIEARTTSTRHVGEPRQMQLVSDSHRLGRAVAMLGQNQIGLAAARIVAFEGIRPM